MHQGQGIRPEADVAINEVLVRRLLEAQYPELAELPLSWVEAGWDNVVFRLGDDLAVRLPRRVSAHGLLLNEVRWLPFLAPRLPVAIPSVKYRGKPAENYPYHWAVVPWFSGQSAACVDVKTRDDLVPELARFFRALHVPAPADAPKNPVRGVPLQARNVALLQRLEHYVGAGKNELIRLWEYALQAGEYAGPQLWLHGDPHPHNVIVTPKSAQEKIRLSAVIDFGDLTAGDPASDLACGWLFFSDSGLQEFRLSADNALYDTEVWERARGWALNYASLMIGLEQSDPLHAVGAHGIEMLLQGA
ncbi:phosphotransferase [Arthrobacter sp. MYb227]|uniref:aminoglycoside phosphotransferase family protein n=1 Tax=Arthrobacter sp. MYb227 TaxID=1848601 RepID=UPI000CFAD98F|nr:aminoglycoside phosphotransferase family protein [Arthrobacter sp. MYb227]PQZ91154.1 phosphotransferase [Arthrobacter sp. MYb227]